MGTLNYPTTSSNKMFRQENNEIFEIALTGIQTVKPLKSTQCYCYFEFNIIFPYKTVKCFLIKQ